MKKEVNKKSSKIAENLKRIRNKKHVSKSKLVLETGLDYHTIAKIENGITPDPRVGTLKKIANALKVPLDSLVG
jgi:transcriptional regulator with XRE-family HTH domain